MEKLLPILESKVKPEERRIQISEKDSSLTMPLDLLKSGRLRTILNSCYIAIANIFILEKKYTDAINTLNKGINAGADKYQCYGGLALAHYYYSGVEKALEYTEKMNEVKKNTLIYFLNMAFFSIKEGDYKKVVYNYDEAKKKYKRENKVTIEQTIQFLKDRQEEEPEVFAYTYGIGILTYNFIDKEQGKEHISQLLSNADTMVEYAPIVKVAKTILKIKQE